MILITGGAGFIGSNLQAALAQRGLETIVVDTLGCKGKWQNLAKHAPDRIIHPDGLDAFLDTKPALEIYADDVKCTHGATIGQIDADAIFYLRSRGIGRQEARDLLTYAFANDILGRIKYAPLRERLSEGLFARLASGQRAVADGAGVAQKA